MLKEKREKAKNGNESKNKSGGTSASQNTAGGEPTSGGVKEEKSDLGESLLCFLLASQLSPVSIFWSIIPAFGRPLNLTNVEPVLPRDANQRWVMLQPRLGGWLCKIMICNAALLGQFWATRGLQSVLLPDFSLIFTICWKFEGYFPEKPPNGGRKRLMSQDYHVYHGQLLLISYIWA